MFPESEYPQISVSLMQSEAEYTPGLVFSTDLLEGRTGFCMILG